MKILVVNSSEVCQLLSMAECIEVMHGTFEALSRRDVILPHRSRMYLPGRTGALITMPSYQTDMPVMGVKVISNFPCNLGTEHNTIQGAMMLFESANGRLQAIVDAFSLTAIRTAAVSGLATQLLAREDASELAILGSGTQARTHLEAMLAVRQIGTIRIWSRDLNRAGRFAQREGTRRGLEITVAESAEEAVLEADLICTTTAATEPVLLGKWLAPGSHINAVGSSVPFARELDTEAVLRSKIFVDRIEAALAEAGDFLIPKQEGAIDELSIRSEIGDVLTGRCFGRESPQEITLFKSVGLAVEDLAAVNYVYHKALRVGAGTMVELDGGRRESDGVLH